MSKCSLVIGATGQDGSYLCELLLNRNYQIHAMVTSDAPERLTN
jgi:GDPmannose 4,6-dehydratase